MADRKIVEELGIAYRTEINGHAFYTAAAKMSTQERGKNFFSHLATEELDHIRVISRIGEALKSGEGWISYEVALKESLSSEKGLPIFQKENELTRRLAENPSDTNAVAIAIENEEEAVEFYSRLLNGAETTAEKVVLTKLLEMEKGHLKVLRWESESLRKTGFWGDTMEFSVEKEAD